MFKFTVFTPTYNRANKIHRVYYSLLHQTYRGFEWLVVDDGSTDNTKGQVENWRNEAPFEIVYIYQSNQGQHVAINKGVQNARGELFLPADSDDEFLPNALSIFIAEWNAIVNQSEFSGVTGLCIDSITKKVVGNTFPEDTFDSNYLESRYKYNIWGEKWGFIKTSILKEFPFPDSSDQRHIYPGIVWMQIARKYKTRYLNIPLRVYYQNEAGTQTKSLHKYPRQLMEWYLIDINENSDYLSLNRWRYIESFLFLGKTQILSRYPTTKLIRRLKRETQRAIFILLYPLSSILAIISGAVKWKEIR